MAQNRSARGHPFDAERMRRLDDFDQVQAVRKGLTPAVFDRVVKHYGLTADEAAVIISRRTLARRRNNKERLSTNESSRLDRLMRVLAQAEETFGSPERAVAWLRRPNRALQGTAPMEILDSDRGARTVENLLGRIDHGIFA